MRSLWARLSNPDRIGVLMSGVLALAGAYVGIRIAGFLLLEAFFEPEPASGETTSELILDGLSANGLEFLIRGLIAIVLGSSIGWILAPALAGKLLGWSRPGVGIGYQLTMGVVLVPLSIWLFSFTVSEAPRLESVVGWALVIVVGAGVPTVARLAALRVGRRSVASSDLGRPTAQE